MENKGEQLAGSLALLFFLLLTGYFSSVTRTAAPQTESLKPIVPQSVMQFNPALIVSTTTVEHAFPHLESTTTTVLGEKVKTVVIVPGPVKPKPVPAPATSTVPVPAAKQEPAVPATAVGSAKLKQALVNILCTSHNQNLRGVSGSGVIIDPQGIILTVAHVAQSELLAETLGEGTISCVIRTGDPARSAYKAKLIYISAPWLYKNPTTLISSQPMGTGENDFAFLAITESAGASLPSSFPYVPLSSETAGVGESVYVGGYGAQYLSSAQIRSSLSPDFSDGTVDALYTFHSATQDLLAVLAGKVAQEGSSGGGAVNKDGELIGLITTSEISGDFSTRHVRVLTPLHIKTSFKDDMGQNLSSYLGASSPATLITSFSATRATLGTYLAHAIGLE